MRPSTTPPPPTPADSAPGGPRRTCVGCRAVRPQRELIRIARDRVGTLVVGRTLPGRGAWLCRASPSCLDLALGRGGFARSFRTPISRSEIEALRSSASADLG